MDDFFARIRLSAYLDGELTDAEMAEVARALEEQPELRQAYEELQAAVELLRRRGPVQAPARLHAAIMREIEAEPRRRRWVERLLGPLGRYPAQTLGVAVVAAAVILVVLRGPAVVAPPSGEQPMPVDDAERLAAAPAGAPDAAQPGTAQGADPSSPEEQGLEATGEQPSGPDEFDAPGKLGSISSRPEPSAKARDEEASPLREVVQGKKGGTYVPGWDKEQDAGPTSGQEAEGAVQAAALGGVSPFSYRLTPSSPDVLRRLVALAEKLQGGAFDDHGQPLDPYILTVERNYARVLLRIPASQIESVEPYLKSMGGLVTVRAEQELIFAVDSVEVEIEVQYLP